MSEYNIEDARKDPRCNGELADFIESLQTENERLRRESSAAREEHERLNDRELEWIEQLGAYRNERDTYKAENERLKDKQDEDWRLLSAERDKVALLEMASRSYIKEWTDCKAENERLREMVAGHKERIDHEVEKYRRQKAMAEWLAIELYEERYEVWENRDRDIADILQAAREAVNREDTTGQG